MDSFHHTKATHVSGFAQTFREVTWYGEQGVDGKRRGRLLLDRGPGVGAAMT